MDDSDRTAAELNCDLERIKLWTRDWLVTINSSKTKSITFSAKRYKVKHPTLVFDNAPIEEVNCHKHLGVTLSSNLSWKAHILNIYEKASKRLNLLKGLKYKIGRDALAKLYKSLIRPIMEYADVLWDGCTENDSDLLEFVQYEAAKVVTGAMRGTSRQRLLAELSWDELKTRRSTHKLVLFFKIAKKLVPEYLYNLLPLTVQQRSGMSLRSANDFSVFSARTERYKNSFFPSSTRLWNSIDRETRETDSIRAFKKALCHFFNTSSYNNCFDYAIDRYSSILHTRLRLNCCALNYYLFKINCAISPACACGANHESIKHYLLHCPRYAALRFPLLSAAAQVLNDRWHLLSESHKVNVLLTGADDLSPAENKLIFHHVQLYIKRSTRFANNQ